MTFQETLAKHLSAIQERNLGALVETLPSSNITLITSDGRLVTSVDEFVEMHRGWFAMTSWQLAARVLRLLETADFGLAVVHLDYQEDKPDGQRIHETSVLTLGFARLQGSWLMVHDQNTPIRRPT